MVAERVTATDLPSQAEQAGMLTPQEAEDRLYAIWYEFESGSRKPEDAGRRASALKKFGSGLSPEAEKYLEEEIDVVEAGRKMRVSRGIWIRESATGDARKDLRQKNAPIIAAKEAAAKRSRSEKLEARKQKAYERRGTRPELIH